MATHSQHPVSRKQAKFSRFLLLPLEIRGEIYEWIFASTRLAFGEVIDRSESHNPVRKCIQPAKNSLALLRTCWQIHEETHIIWLNNVVFSFGDCKVMLDKLTEIPRRIRCQIRYLRLGPGLLQVKQPDSQMTKAFSPVAALKLLPDLQLQVLTVHGPEGTPFTYKFLDELLAHGTSWRVLQYVARDSAMLGIVKGPSSRLNGLPYTIRIGTQDPQPATWAGMLRERDGWESSVIIYRFDMQRGQHIVHFTFDHQIYNGTLKAEGLKPISADAQRSVVILNDIAEWKKAVLVVAKRGMQPNHGRSICWPSNTAHSDIRAWTGGLSWSEASKYCVGQMQKWKERALGVEYVDDEYSHIDDDEPWI